MRNAHKLTVDIVFLSDNPAGATDGIGEMIRRYEERLTGGAILDWQFTGEPKSIEVPEAAEYVEGEVFAYTPGVTILNDRERIQRASGALDSDEAELWATALNAVDFDPTLVGPELTAENLSDLDEALTAIRAFYRGGQSKLPVRAEVHDDGHRFVANFDARQWFEQADDDEIVALSEENWGGCTEADEVARFMEDHDDNVSHALTAANEADDCGFECHVCEGDAARWLNLYRPELLKRIYEEQELIDEILLSDNDTDPLYKKLHG